MECNFFALKYKLPCNVMVSGTPESYFSASLSPLKWKRYLGVISNSKNVYQSGCKAGLLQVVPKKKLEFHIRKL